MKCASESLKIRYCLAKKMDCAVHDGTFFGTQCSNFEQWAAKICRLPRFQLLANIWFTGHRSQPSCR